MTTIRNTKHIQAFFIAFLCVSVIARAQYTQNIRGKIVDQLLQQPLSGASVKVTGVDGGAVTGNDGSFRIGNVPVGTRQVTVSYVGYREFVIDNVVVTSGKEVFLNIGLEAEITTEKEISIVAKSRKNKPLNDMSLVSARAFTVEETQKYAAAVNDPLRMATSFAGVIAAFDGSNDIVIRGNSPSGLLWRMEGVDIPNPNHFSNAGSSGGGISILSSQLLSNSDFVTGAFSAEYGNALSGAFDLKLRKGNNEKREYTLQAGLLGINLAAEGPIMPFYKGSYLINYRYSTLQLLDKLGLMVGPEGVLNFQDLSFNVYLPTAKSGDFTVFGFGGLSSQDDDVEMDQSKWETEGDRYGEVFKSNTSTIGLTHAINAGSKTYIKSTAAFSLTENIYDEKYVRDATDIVNSFYNKYNTRKWSASTVVNHKVTRKHSVRAGVTANLIKYKYYQKSREHRDDPVLERINQSDATQTIQGFGQWQYRATDKLTFQGGLHYLALLLNNTSSLEPRASAKYNFDGKNSVSFGYGLHSQIQPLGVYFAKTYDESGRTLYLNKDLEFSKSHHFVLSYAHAFSNTLRLKAEMYYQRLFNIPISIYDSLSFSTLNIEGDYVTEPLVNDGKGKNYGVDLTLEKHLSANSYFILNQSVYSSRYTASDGIERNTRFNGNHLTSFTGGKDFVRMDARKSFGFNVKLIYAGGFRTTPIDVESSMQKGYTVYRENEAFSLQNPAYFRADIGLNMKWNRKHRTNTLSLDIQNVTNRQNIYGQYYDPYKSSVDNEYQVGIIPVLNYKVEF